MDRGAWQPIVHGITKDSDTKLNNNNIPWRTEWNNQLQNILLKLLDFKGKKIKLLIEINI